MLMPDLSYKMRLPMRTSGTQPTDTNVAHEKARQGHSQIKRPIAMSTMTKN
jgi:hypothetical protein